MLQFCKREIAVPTPARLTRLLRARLSLISWYHWSLLHPPLQSNLKITKRSFRHAALHMWNKLPPSLRIPSTGSIPSFSDSRHGPVCDLSYGAFHSRLETHLFFKSFPP